MKGLDILKIVIPEEQILCKSIEIECIPFDNYTVTIRFFADVLELSRKARLSDAVVGKKQYEVTVTTLEIITQLGDNSAQGSISKNF